MDKSSYSNPPRTLGDAPIPANTGDYQPIEIECSMDSPAEDAAEMGGDRMHKNSPPPSIVGMAMPNGD